MKQRQIFIEKSTQPSPPGAPDERLDHELSPERYKVLIERATEPPWTGEYLHHFDEGVFVCAGCGADLFSSSDKFDSGTGWPSFKRPIGASSIVEVQDLDLGMIRTEITCASCGGHLGHVFNDGPTDSGLRYCVNSLSLEFHSEPTPPSRTPSRSQ
ncbi:MAG: peptide-methionine (R)-S-oxide reductase MsrB [Actinobacteria bacterium]|jgi:peptide-methionine (R)-S-oxide reductase|nr:peptide-methionine (R)-S-oxide reductase MsrB [Actinomycetota bacterium]